MKKRHTMLFSCFPWKGGQQTSTTMLGLASIKSALPTFVRQSHTQCLKSPKQNHLIPLKYHFDKNVRLSRIFLTKLRLFHGFHYAMRGAHKPYLPLVFRPSLMGLFLQTSSPPVLGPFLRYVQTFPIETISGRFRLLIKFNAFSKKHR